MNKKIAIASCFYINNYGSALQAFATQYALDELGYLNTTIDAERLNSSNNSTKILFYLKHIFDIKTFVDKLKIAYSAFLRKTNPVINDIYKRRNRKFLEFRKRFRTTDPCATISDIQNTIKREYDAVLVGSDQLWLPSNIQAGYYTLTWVPEGIRRISYATSFGVSNLPEDVKQKAKDFLEKMDYLSVREETGSRIVERLIGKKPELVCDPTMLLNAEQWNVVCSNGPLIPGDYIFCYFLGYNKRHREFAKQLSKITGFPVVSIPHAGKYKKCDVGYADSEMIEAGPAEFINLIKHARYVCTDSFHGTVFSIIYQTQFFTFYRFAEKSQGSTNTRISSLFSLLDFSGRLIPDDYSTVGDYLDIEIPFDKMLRKIDILKNESIAFLKKSIETS